MNPNHFLTEQNVIFTSQNGVGAVIVESTKCKLPTERVHRYEIPFEIPSVLRHADLDSIFVNNLSHVSRGKLVQQH